MTLETIEAKALKLPLQERGKLAAALLASLDHAEPAEIDRMWENEIHRREQKVLSGKAKLLPAKEVFARSRKSVKP